MQLRSSELDAQLRKSLLPAYAIHGDEPLLAMEAADAIRAAARRAGFTEREVLEPGRGFDWSEFTHATGSLSLFATKKIVELRLPTGKPGPQGSAAIAAYCERRSEDRAGIVEKGATGLEVRGCETAPEEFDRLILAIRKVLNAPSEA